MKEAIFMRALVIVCTIVLLFTYLLVPAYAAGKQTEGDALFQTFYEAVVSVDGDTSWGDVMLGIGEFSLGEIGFVQVAGNAYVTYGYGGTQDWQDMPDFIKTLWVPYLNPRHLLSTTSTREEREFFFGSEDIFIKNSLIELVALNLMSGFYEGDGRITEAYEALMRWQFRYYARNNRFYNFMAYFDIPLDKIPDLTPENGMQADSTATPHPSAPGTPGESNGETGAGEDEPENKGVWDRLLDKLLKPSNLITIGVLIVLAVAVFIVVGKRKAMDLEDSE
jgi:hypothetical protein